MGCAGGRTASQWNVHVFCFSSEVRNSLLSLQRVLLFTNSGSGKNYPLFFWMQWIIWVRTGWSRGYYSPDALMERQRRPNWETATPNWKKKKVQDLILVSGSSQGTAVTTQPWWFGDCHNAGASRTESGPGSCSANLEQPVKSDLFFCCGEEQMGAHQSSTCSHPSSSLLNPLG